MKRFGPIFVIVALAAVCLLAYQATQPPDDASLPDRVTSHDESYVELLNQYQAALSEANSIIDELNLDVATAQQIDRLEDLETYVDSIPARDIVAHPQLAP